MTTQYKTLEQLVTTLELQSVQRADYVVGPAHLEMKGGLMHVAGSTGGIYSPNQVFHEQIATRAGIPLRYYERMKQYDDPELLGLMDTNVNTWLKKETGKYGILFRSFETQGDGNIARALLSDRYGIMDNYDVLFAALDAVKQTGVHLEVKECDITDRRLYVFMTCPEIEVEAEHALRNYLRNRVSGDKPVGKGLLTGIVITNSEVGCGRYSIRPRGWIIRCENGMIVPDDSFQRIHLGAKLEQGKLEWSEKTKRKNLELITSMTADAVKHFISREYFDGVVRKLEAASNQELEQPLVACENVIKEVSKAVTIDDTRKASILKHFQQGGDFAASGIFNAMTREAGNMDMDNRYSLEEAAFRILPEIHKYDKPYSAN